MMKSQLIYPFNYSLAICLYHISVSPLVPLLNRIPDRNQQERQNCDTDCIQQPDPNAVP